MNASPRALVTELVWPDRGRLLSAAVLSGLATAAGAVLLGVSLALLTWSSWQPPILQMLVAIVAVRALALVRASARYGERLVGHDAALRVVGAARQAAWRGWSRDPAPFAAERTGDLLQRVVGDLDHVQQLLVGALVPIGGALLVGLGVVAAVGAFSVPAGLSVAGGLLVAGGVVPWVGHRVTRRRRPVLLAVRGRLAGDVVEAMEGREELQVLGAVDAVGDRLAAAADEVARHERALARVDALAVIGIALAAAASLAAVVHHLAGVALDGRWYAALAGITLAGFEAVAPLPAAAGRLADGLAALDRLVLSPPPPRTLGRAGDGVLVSLDGVAVDARLAPVTLALRPGSRLAVRAPSGGGKSTLAQVLGGLAVPSHGRIATDGARALRDVVGVVAQEPVVFAASIRDNLLVAAPHASEDELRAVLDVSGLTPWLEGLPHGLDSRVGELAEGLSGGQAHRLAVARALLAPHDVLVLDEPTAALDPRSSVQLVAAVDRAAGERAVLYLTHDTAVAERLPVLDLLPHPAAAG